MITLGNTVWDFLKASVSACSALSGPYNQNSPPEKRVQTTSLLKVRSIVTSSLPVKTFRGGTMFRRLARGGCIMAHLLSQQGKHVQ